MKDNALSAMVSVLEVVSKWLAEVITILPVLGVYATFVIGFGKLPTSLWTPFVTADKNVCT